MQPKIPRPFACPSLSQTVTCKVLLGIQGLQPKIPRPFACPGLRPDRDMQSTFRL